MEDSCRDDDRRHERHDEDQGRQRPDRGRERHEPRLFLEEMTRRIHQERCARGKTELPDGAGREGGGEEKRKIDLDAFALRLAGKIDRHQRPQREGETPEEITQTRDHHAAQRDDLAAGSGKSGEPGNRVSEYWRGAQNRTQHQDQHHLHRERKQHPETAGKRVQDGGARIADGQRPDGEEQQHADGRRHGIRNDPADEQREPGQPIVRSRRRFFGRVFH